MNIFITGGLGFVGRHVSRAFLQAGHRVTAIGRTQRPDMIDHPNFHYLAADTTQPGDWQGAVAEHQAVVNLAGRSIFTFWTDNAKKEMVDSRVLTTRHLVDAIAPDGRTVLCSTSAVGYYGDRGEARLSEDAAPGDDFLASLAHRWEAEALKAEAKGARVVLTRFGIVLERGGGAMAMMTPLFRLFLGGPLGSGRQWFPWIHMHDLTAAFQYAVDRENLAGPFNFCAPNPVRNRRLTRTLAEKLNRPALLRAPSFMVKLLMGEFGRVLLHSQRAMPDRLLEAGFEFQYPTIEAALAEIVA
jgi:uncharacterized protein (TIGR01777 family)